MSVLATRLRRPDRRAAGVLAGLLVAASASSVVAVPASARASTVPAWQVVAPRILNPVGVAVDAAGDYFVDEPSFQGVEEITPSGSMTVLDQSITEPGALFVTAAGTVYVADNSTGTIDEITTNGTVSVATTVPDPGNGTISQIAVSSTSGTIWFTQYTTLWEAQPGGAATDSGFPWGSIAADDQGNIYDTGQTAMEKIAANGTSTPLPAVWAGAGTIINSDAAGDIYADGPAGSGGIRYGNTYFPTPQGGAWNVAPDGDVVEANTSYLDRITRSMATTYVATQDLTEGLTLVTGPDGSVQVGGTETLAPCQVQVSSSGAEVPAASSTGATENCGGPGPVAGGGGTPAEPWNQEFFYLHQASLEAFTELEGGGTGSVQAFGPQGVQFGGIASNGTNDVWTWTGQGAGTEVEEVAFPSGTVTDVAAVPYVTALGVDGAGDVFVGYNGSKLEEIPAGGGTPTVLSTSLVNPAGITIDPSGNLWVTSGDEILEDVGGVLTQIGPDLSGPTSIAFDSAGNLYALAQDGVEELVQVPSPPPSNPEAPSNVVASPAAGSAAVSWDAPTSDGGSTITSYTATATPGGRTCTWSGGPLTCTVLGLTNGAAYTFTVTATNAVGTGPASSASSAVTPATSPDPPTGVQAAPGYASATASWVAPVNDGGDAVASYLATASPSGQWCAWSSGPLSCTITGLINGDSYTITVTATSSGGTSVASTPSGFVVPAGPPGPPTNVTAIAGDASATVSWSPPSEVNAGDVGVTRYTVTASPGGRSCTWNSGPLTCNVPGLTNGVPYTFSVDATNFDGTGPGSAPTSPVTPATEPDAPTGVNAAAGDASAMVSWTAPASDGGRAVTAYTATAAPGGKTCSWSSGALRCNLTGLTNGTAYTFTVTATNATGTGAASSASSAVTPATVPGVPTAVRAAPHSGAALIHWVAPASDGGSTITSYTATAAPGGTSCSWTSGPLSCTVSGLTNGVAYTFTVTATNAKGTGATSGASPSVTPAALPGAPMGIGLGPGNGSVAIRWSAPSSNGGSPVTGYTVTAVPSDRTCSTSGDTCVISGLSAMREYRFSVVAKNAVGAGPAATSSALYPFHPSGLGLEVGTPVLTSGTSFLVVAAGAKSGAMVRLTLAGAVGAACTASIFGQCMASMIPLNSGALTLRASSSASGASLAVFVPLLSAPTTLPRGAVTTITVSSCPRSARVVLFLSDGRRFVVHGSASGVATFRVRLLTAGKVVARATVDGVKVEPARTIVAT
jgi:hypothetical protein